MFVIFSVKNSTNLLAKSWENLLREVPLQQICGLHHVKFAKVSEDCLGCHEFWI